MFQKGGLSAEAEAAERRPWELTIRFNNVVTPHTAHRRLECPVRKAVWEGRHEG